MAVEQHVEDGLDPQRERAGRQRIAERLGNGLGTERVAVLAELLPVVEHREALLEGEQLLGAARLDPADHVGHLQAFLVILVLDQGQLVDGHLGGLFLGFELAFEEIVEVLSDLLVIAALDTRALTADFAHVVEEQRLHLVVLGLFRTFEKGVVNLAEHAGQMLGQAVHRQLPAVLHQFAEAWLDDPAGKRRRGFSLGRRVILIIVHGRS
ncbi:hypothetical protein D9M68_571590 [compost metagenome]